jgi:capsular polysaccharide biosynthesis protein
VKEVTIHARYLDMELADASRRILLQHWRLIAACMLVAAVVATLALPKSPAYTAAARLVLDVSDPQTNSETVGIADTVKAIATSPSEIALAMREMGVKDRNPAAVSLNSVSVASLGQSAIVDLSVSDRDPRVAAALANALAARVIHTRLEVTRGQASRATNDLDRRISKTNQQIGDAQIAVDRLTIQMAKSPAAAVGLRARHDEAVRQVDLLNQTRSSLESERVSLLSSSALQRDPQVISPATPPRTKDSSGFVQDLVLGLFLGLIMGVGSASLIETVRPKLVGSDAVARELDAPLLGTLSTEPGEASEAELGPLALRVRLAGRAAGLPNLRLLPVREGTDLDGFARWLNDRRVSDPAPLGQPAVLRPDDWYELEGAHNDPTPSRSTPAFASAGREGGALSTPTTEAPFRIRPFDPESALMNGTHMGLVLVSPDRLATSEIEAVRHLLRVTPGLVLGVVTYRQPRRVKGLVRSKRKSNDD